MEVAVAVIGERSGIEALYRSDAARLWRAIYAYSGDAEIASDAVAEAFAQLLRRGAEVRDPAAWTWRAAFRLCAGALKERRADVSAVGPSSQSDRYADTDLIAALRRLPDGQRAAVILYYYADLPAAEIARRLGSNGIAVRANLSRGRRRLRQLLEDDDD
jgi:RNA polymerase sigma-70 factor (ECF subfamily)